jgi:hypothetical protein
MPKKPPSIKWIPLSEAVGRIAEKYDISEAEAFNVLRKARKDHDVDMRDAPGRPRGKSFFEASAFQVPASNGDDIDEFEIDTDTIDEWIAKRDPDNAELASKSVRRQMIWAM